MPKEKPTLERIMNALGKNFSEERAHAALLLSFAESIYSVVRRDCTPSPLYRVSFDKTNRNVGVEETQGHSLVPKKGVLDIDDLDILLMCNLREIPGLIEGETGIGKTFVSQRYLSTVFTSDQFFSHRLSGNAFVNNLFQHFQEGKMVDGMPVIEARVDRIETTAAGIIDEINRGDPNDTLQLFDNEMHLGGLIYKLGIPIPEIKDGRYVERSGRKKKLFLISAQNPSSTDDAKFTGTMQLDAAVDNRLLKTYMSNAAPSAGSTVWLGDGKGKRHDVFMKSFASRAAKHLGIEEAVMQDGDASWLQTYAWITDSSKTDKPVLYSALELADFMTAVFGGNLLDYFKYERQVIADWKGLNGGNVEIKDGLKETAKVKTIHEVTDSFKVPMIFRDIDQVKKVADILSTLKNVKDALRTENPVQSYLDARKVVTVREIAEATALVVRNKQKPSSPSPINAINEVLNQYCSLVEEYMKESKKFHPNFDIYDPQTGIKSMAVIRAIRENMGGAGGIENLAGRIQIEAGKLTTKISLSEEVRNIMIARSVGDLMTLSGFILEHKKALQDYKEAGEKIPAMSKYKKITDAPIVAEAMGRFYCKVQKEDAIILPALYQHRIQRTLGIENAY